MDKPDTQTTYPFTWRYHKAENTILKHSCIFIKFFFTFNYSISSQLEWIL